MPDVPQTADIDAEIARVVRSEAARLRHLARHLIGESDVDDAVQEAWQAVYAGRSSYRGESKLSHWAMRVARSKLIDFARWRAARRKHEVVADVAALEPIGHVRDEPFSAAERNERVARVRAALVGLPLIYREVLTLRSFSGLRYAEIADELSVPIGTVRSRIAAGSAMLADRLREESGGGS